MFCFISQLVEDCYFDTIEMFFFVVGHTHNILDQWFGVLAKAIRAANFIGSVIAMHAIYEIAHQEKVRHLRPKEVHQLELYHDWRKHYSVVMNDQIHHFNIPLRWRISRCPTLSVAKSEYQVVSPTAGMTHLETWQPVPSKLDDLDDTGSVELTMFMTYNGPEALYNAIGINTDKMTSSVELLNAVSSKKTTNDNVGNATAVLPTIQAIEVRAICETEVRMQQEADTGFSQEKVPMPKEYLKAIDKEITRTNSSKGGRIVWIRRSKIVDDPECLSRRPDILPNPELWRNLIATEEAKRKLLEEDATCAGAPPPKIKSDPLVKIAETRLIAFRNAAAEMATTANLVLKLIPSQIDVTEATQDIRKATSNFRKPVLTKKEEAWYRSISTSNQILHRQEALVKAELLKPWELLDIPVETIEQKAWRESMLAERAKIAARTEARLRKLVHRLGEGEYDPNLQVVTMDGFDAATTQDIDQMRRPQMEMLAKGHIPGFRALKVDALRKAIKDFMAANPGVMQLPGTTPVSALTATNSSSSSNSSSASTTTIIPVQNLAPVDPSSDVEDSSAIEMIKEGADTAEASSCAVMECDEPAIVWCENCQLSFCSDLHASHTSHSAQTKKIGQASANIWELSVTKEVASSSPSANFQESESKKRKKSSGDMRGEDLDPTTDLATPGTSITIPSNTMNLASSKSRKIVQFSEESNSYFNLQQQKQHQQEEEVIINRPMSSVPVAATVNSVFRLEGDNRDKRQALENQKLSDAINYIKSLQSTNDISSDLMYQKFRYENFYDTNFLCSLANSLYIDVSEVTCKKRYSHKELLNCLINKSI